MTLQCRFPFQPWGSPERSDEALQGRPRQNRPRTRRLWLLAEAADAVQAEKLVGILLHGELAFTGWSD